ncbi:phosphatase PAP2 family protein [Pontibacterium sp.]|jgi:undecaprenyl-diphosphatase|uniref:phosphatase PAP2 family protein n=1 Tax=Pontibacterium sp. TaxID=2036026 RepID=UPI003567F411
MNTLHKITSYDALAFYWCHGLTHMPRLATCSRMISRLGDGGLYLALGLSLAMFEVQDGESFLFAGLLAFALELPLYLILKNTIKRDRPCDRFDNFDAFIIPSDKFSFPSGHAAAAFVFATVLSHFYPSMLVLSYSIAVLIGLSRVMLGVHYPTDIAAGAVLGTSIATVALNVYAL